MAMTTWHRESCKRPDVYPAGNSCYCSSCDTLALLDQVVPNETRSISALPELPAHGGIHFTWPESVQFWDDQDVHIRSSAIGGEHCRAIRACQCYTKGDKIPQQTGSSSRKPREFYAALEGTNKIRLLLLSKGNFDDPIHGTLMIARLSSNIKFQALSYTWADAAGDDSHSKVIFLGPRWDIFMVTANCKAALRRLRRKDDDCMVWVDAICIDQGNHSERNHQVGLMRKIYSAASEVFVYLGEGSSLTEEAFERLMWAKKHESIDEKGRQSLRHLFDMRYFHRIWVIQEIANAKSATIHHGDNAIGWSVLEEERLKTLAIQDTVPKWISSVYLRQEYTTRDLSDLLFSTTSSKASDPRDKVFALLGLINDIDGSGPIADYSLTLQEVQVGVSAFVITHGDDCGILSHAGGFNSNSPAQVPSWVPIWDRQYRSTPIPRGSETFGNYVVLRAEHVLPHVLMKPIVDELAKPRIHHVGGFLSILALKMIDLSHLTKSWAEYLGGKNAGQISEIFPGLALLFDEVPIRSQDEIMLLKGCATIFHVRKHANPNIFKIVGVCNILLSMDRLNCNGSFNISELNIVSHFILQSCPLKKMHLQPMIELETLFKRFGCWNSESYSSPDMNLCESMFSDSMVARAFTIHMEELGIKSTLSKTKSSDFKDDGTESQLLLPTTLQLQWLTTRLRFWDSQSSWEMVNVFDDIYSSWLSWKVVKAELEGALFASLLLRRMIGTKNITKSLANLTISLIDSLLLVTEASHIKECRLQFGELHLFLLQPASSGAILRATSLDIIEAISNLFEKSWADHFSKKRYLAGFRKIDDSYFLFTDWDWSELETIFELLKPFHSSGIRSFRDSCSSRFSLRKLQSQSRNWERITLV